MNTEQKQLIRESWTAVKPLGDEVARLFYQRLFDASPDASAAFEGVDMHAQNHKLFAALDFVVDKLDQPETLLPALEAMGRRHGTYGVRYQDYDAVGAALLDTLERGLGERWNERTEAAWTTAYGLITSVMRPLSCPDEQMGCPATTIQRTT